MLGPSEKLKNSRSCFSCPEAQRLTQFLSRRAGQGRLTWISWVAGEATWPRIETQKMNIWWDFLDVSETFSSGRAGARQILKWCRRMWSLWIPVEPSWLGQIQEGFLEIAGSEAGNQSKKWKHSLRSRGLQNGLQDIQCTDVLSSFLPLSTRAPHRRRHCCPPLPPFLMLLPLQSSDICWAHFYPVPFWSWFHCLGCPQQVSTWLAPSLPPCFSSKTPLSARSSQILKWKKQIISLFTLSLHLSDPALLLSTVIFIIWLPTYLLIY